MNKQNKENSYIQAHVRQALQPANDTRIQELNYANNTE